MYPSRTAAPSASLSASLLLSTLYHHLLISLLSSSCKAFYFILSVAPCRTRKREFPIPEFPIYQLSLSSESVPLSGYSENLIRPDHGPALTPKFYSCLIGLWGELM